MAVGIKEGDPNLSIPGAEIDGAEIGPEIIVLDDSADDAAAATGYAVTCILSRE